MIDVDYSVCTGCGACFAACPKSCISFAENEQGFLYPDIDKDNCIDCHKCEKVCMATKPKLEKNETAACFAAYCKDDTIRKQSSSGGLFNVLACEVLDEGGVVFGAGFDDEFSVCHYAATNSNELKKLMGSKYVQSRTGYSYIEAERYLKEGKRVYFSGTPCQILGLYNYLGCDYDNLITQDVICHGVPSPLVWEKYLSFVTHNGKKKIESISFRDKTTGWMRFSMTVNFTNASKYSKTHGNDAMMNAFLKNICLRHSCYNCVAKANSVSDITLGDFWGIETVFPKLNDDLGVSAVLCNTKKGKALFDSVTDSLVSEETDYDTVLRRNPNLKRSPVMPTESDNFMQEIKDGDFEKTISKYCKTSLYKRINKKIKRILK